MLSISDYILGLDGNQKKTMQFLHQFILSFPGMEDKMRYKIPFYYRNTWICYLNPLKNDEIELAFTRANELRNVNHLLRFNDRKQVAGMVIKHPKDIDEETLRVIINEAILLDEEVPYASKRRKQ
jgi:hypothetical protein